MNKKEIEFVLQNREMLLQIANKFLEYYKTIIWKEKNIKKKMENSAVADRIEDLMGTIKSLKFETPDKKGGDYTGV